jgi:hypothetical protein
MGTMKRTRAALAVALAAAAALLPGCYAARSAFRNDPSSLAYSGSWFGRTFAEQCDEFGDDLTGWPSALGDHFSECWKNITTDPRDLPQ